MTLIRMALVGLGHIERGTKQLAVALKANKFARLVQSDECVTRRVAGEFLLGHSNPIDGTPLLGPQVEQLYGRSRKFLSTAFDHVIPPEFVDALEVRPNEMSLKGEDYKAANGSPITNYGAATIVGKTDNGVSLTIPFNVARVGKALISSTRIIEQGHRVNLEKENNYIDCQGKARIPLQIVNGSAVFTIWRKRIKHEACAVFARRE